MKTENKGTEIGARLNSPATKIPEKERTENIRRNLRIVSSVPTKAPRNQYEAQVLYSNGGTRRLYVYDENAGSWHYASLT